ncbi:MAG TPA: polysaccharide deacetylase family protein, partial [Blastocatellia bacterium]|nr:polysaccharide deacetylase family protein [Blastocatellia bacterium]
MKRAILNLMRMTGAFAPFRRANRDKALIITYHRFSERDAEAATSARAFSEQLEYLRAHYTIMPLSEMARAMSEGSPLPRASVAITIDDGYRDAREIAFPLLRKYGAPATLFVVTDFVDGRTWLWTDKSRFLTFNAPSGAFEVTVAGRALTLKLNGRASRFLAADRVNSALKALPDDAKQEAIDLVAGQLGVEPPASPPEEFAPITWDEAREMDGAGVEIGSHTVTHPILTRVAGDRLSFELRQSRARLEAMLGRQVGLFCYPNGDFNSDVRAEVERAGYLAAVTTEAGLNAAR